VGTGSPSRSAVPTLSGPSCAAPNLSSCDPSSNSLEQNVVVRNTAWCTCRIT
jgi:hypothetical protein